MCSHQPGDTEEMKQIEWLRGRADSVRYDRESGLIGVRGPHVDFGELWSEYQRLWGNPEIYLET